MFGSEIKAILALAGESARLSFAVAGRVHDVPEHLRRATRCSRGSRCCRRGRGFASSHDGTTQARHVLRPDRRSPSARPATVDSWTRCGAVLQRAVDRQLMSDVPVGAYLSGGMDSASLVVLAARRIPHIHTFTAGFDVADASPLELAADERAGRRDRRPRGGHRALRGGACTPATWRGCSRAGVAPGGPARRAPRTRTSSWRGWRRSS